MALKKTETLLTGLWMDGVPFNSDRSQSLETVVMNILCDSTMRLPIACFPKEFAAKKKTYECVFDVLPLVVWLLDGWTISVM